jgi:glycosyltransferase involved in cell wall biosynthesis
VTSAGAGGAPLRVGFVLGTTFGGTGRHVAMLARASAAAGLTVRLFGPLATRALVPAAEFTPVAISDRPRPAGDLLTVLRLRRALGSARLDVVHAHGLRAGAFAALALRLPGPARPALVVTVHNARPAGARLAAIYALLERIVARRAAVVLCVSPDLADRMRELGAKDVRPAVVPAATADHAGPAGEPSAAELASAGRPIVLGVGRLAPQKDFATLLLAAATPTWRSRQPPPLVLIAGAGPLAGDLAAQAAELDVPVRFLGERRDVAELLAVACVFVLPSQWEGQPLILQEALRAGVPIVATAVGGIPWLAGEAALLVPAGEPAALSRAVLQVLDDEPLARRLADGALARAAELPTEAAAAAAVLRLYQGLAPRP